MQAANPPAKIFEHWKKEAYRECGFFSPSVCPNQATRTLGHTQVTQGQAVNFFRKMVKIFASPFFPPPVTILTFSRSFPTMKVSALLFAAAGFATASAVELTPDVSYTFPVLLFVGYPVSGGSLLLRHPPREPTDNNCRNEIRPGGQCSRAAHAIIR